MNGITFVYVLKLVDTSIDHSCRDLIDSVHMNEESAKRRKESYETEPDPTGKLVYEIERKILHKV